jgi:hypothetical protein
MDIVNQFLQDTLLKEHKTIYKFIFILIVSGVLLIIINSVTHLIIQLISEWIKIKSENRKIVNKNLPPLIKSTGSLISRMIEIICEFQKPTLYDIRIFHQKILEDRIKEIANGEVLNRHESTAYRLIAFFAYLDIFERSTSNITGYKYLDSIQYYADNKILMGFRGKIYKSKTSLSSQVQDRISNFFWNESEERKECSININNFVSLLNDKNKLEIFKYALNFFYVQTNQIENFNEKCSIDTNDRSWQQIMTLAHVTIYLIDLYQDFNFDPDWEVYRVYLVALIKEWNENTKQIKKVHLYNIGDLDTNNYYDTFSKNIFYVIKWYNYINILLIVKKYRIKYSLNKRGKIFKKRHYMKKITKFGVNVYLKSRIWSLKKYNGKGNCTINIYKNNFATTKNELENFLKIFKEGIPK